MKFKSISIYLTVVIVSFAAVILTTQGFITSKMVMEKQNEFGQQMMLEELNNDLEGSKAIALNLGVDLESFDANQEAKLSNDLPDAVSDKLGAIMTVFVKKGDDFYRVVTNVKDEQGNRAVGTTLNRESESYASVMGGKRFTGETNLFGVNYFMKLVALMPIFGRTWKKLICAGG